MRREVLLERLDRLWRLRVLPLDQLRRPLLVGAVTGFTLGGANTKAAKATTLTYFTFSAAPGWRPTRRLTWC